MLMVLLVVRLFSWGEGSSLISSRPVFFGWVVICCFFNRISPGCEFSDEGLSGIRVEGSELILDDLLDSFGVVFDL